MTAATEEPLRALDALAHERGLVLERDVPLGPLTTLRVGGPADRLAIPRTVEELRALVTLASDAGVPVFVLGKGSDVVVADAGIRGLVIRNRVDELSIVGQRVRGGSGVAMATIVKRATEAGLAGLEWGISIPGSLGGAVWANAGAHGGDVSQVLVSTEVLDPRDGELRELPAAECGYAYRESRFKHEPLVILNATLEAPGRDDPGAIAARVADHQRVRRDTQPLADQNAGSVFRNPPGDHSGRLIEAAGLKGHRIGSARVSEKHANFLVTDRGGSAADVRTLGDHVRATVLARFGVELRYEIEFVGAWPEARP
jgi:UDP-N-acetylmuramate dehydrogenase